MLVLAIGEDTTFIKQSLTFDFTKEPPK